jgi:nicotinamidase-related amidase
MEKNICVHIIVDMLYDFIDGSLACENGENAVHKAVAYINNHPEQKVFYVCDHHPASHCSFKRNGGIWPPHCVRNTHGGAVHKAFAEDVEAKENRPSLKNKFYKGCNPKKEQYSGYEAVSSDGTSLGKAIKQAAKEAGCNGTIFVAVSGIATEFCVKATVLDLQKNGYAVELLENALAWVTKKAHLETLKELKDKKVIMIHA